MKNLQVKNNIYYYEVSSKPNVDIIGITVFTRKQNIFETVFTSYYVLYIQYSIGNWFGYRERVLSMELNSYFLPIIKKHTIRNY